MNSCNNITKDLLFNYAIFYFFMLAIKQKTKNEKIRKFCCKYGIFCDCWRTNSWRIPSFRNIFRKRKSCNSFSTCNSFNIFTLCKQNIHTSCCCRFEAQRLLTFGAQVCGFGKSYRFLGVRSNIFDLNCEISTLFVVFAACAVEVNPNYRVLITCEAFYFMYRKPISKNWNLKQSILVVDRMELFFQGKILVITI